MPSKILSQSGISLADAYEVQGSIAGVENLDSEDVKVVHEMGGTMFSERLSGTIRRRSTGDLNQSTIFNQLITDLPAGPFKISNVVVLADLSARVNNIQVSIRDPISERESPFFIWDNTTDVTNDIRIQDDGAAVADMRILIPAASQSLQGLVQIGGGQPQSVPDIAMRGQTLAFGAGTVEIILLLYLEFSQVGGISSFGLPIPGW